MEPLSLILPVLSQAATKTLSDPRTQQTLVTGFKTSLDSTPGVIDAFGRYVKVVVDTPARFVAAFRGDYAKGDGQPWTMPWWAWGLVLLAAVLGLGYLVVIALPAAAARSASAAVGGVSSGISKAIAGSVAALRGAPIELVKGGASVAQQTTSSTRDTITGAVRAAGSVTEAAFNEAGDTAADVVRDGVRNAKRVRESIFDLFT